MDIEADPEDGVTDVEEMGWSYDLRAPGIPESGRPNRGALALMNLAT